MSYGRYFTQAYSTHLTPGGFSITGVITDSNLSVLDQPGIATGSSSVYGYRISGDGDTYNLNLTEVSIDENKITFKITGTIINGGPGVFGFFFEVYYTDHGDQYLLKGETFNNLYPLHNYSVQTTTVGGYQLLFNTIEDSGKDWLLTEEIDLYRKDGQKIEVMKRGSDPIFGYGAPLRELTADYNEVNGYYTNYGDITYKVYCPNPNLIYIGSEGYSASSFRDKVIPERLLIVAQGGGGGGGGGNTRDVFANSKGGGGGGSGAFAVIILNTSKIKENSSSYYLITVGGGGLCSYYAGPVPNVAFRNHGRDTTIDYYATPTSQPIRVLTVPGGQCGTGSYYGDNDYKDYGLTSGEGGNGGGLPSYNSSYAWSVRRIRGRRGGMGQGHGGDTRSGESSYDVKVTLSNTDRLVEGVYYQNNVKIFSGQSGQASYMNGGGGGGAASQLGSGGIAGGGYGGSPQSASMSEDPGSSTFDGHSYGAGGGGMGYTSSGRAGYGAPGIVYIYQ